MRRPHITALDLLAVQATLLALFLTPFASVAWSSYRIEQTHQTPDPPLVDLVIFALTAAVYLLAIFAWIVRSKRGSHFVGTLPQRRRTEHTLLADSRSARHKH